MNKLTKLSLVTGIALCLFVSFSVYSACAANTSGDRVHWHGSLRAIRTLIVRGDANDVVATIDSVLSPDVTYNDSLKEAFYAELRDLDSGLVK